MAVISGVRLSRAEPHVVCGEWDRPVRVGVSCVYICRMIFISGFGFSFFFMTLNVTLLLEIFHVFINVFWQMNYITGEIL